MQTVTMAERFSDKPKIRVRVFSSGQNWRAELSFNQTAFEVTGVAPADSDPIAEGLRTALSNLNRPCSVDLWMPRPKEVNPFDPESLADWKKRQSSTLQELMAAHGLDFHWLSV